MKSAHPTHDAENARSIRRIEGPRILFYSHDSFGLGHLRRSMTLASSAAARYPTAEVVVATGSPCATHFLSPPGVDVLKLPSITKDTEGRYVARTLRRDLESILALRGRLLEGLVESFLPDVLVVDHQVLGLHGELGGALRRARALGTRTVLGLRDVIDEPAVVRRAWDDEAIQAALATGYDRVCVYGCPRVFDPRIEYALAPEIARRMHFLGYVVRAAPRRALSALPSDRPRVLVTTGGGEDGATRIEKYLECLRVAPVFWDSVVVLGPLLDPPQARRIKRRARNLPGVDVHVFHSDLPHLLGEVDAVVSMAGYNTTAEILQSGVSAVFLPRCFPRREQQLRAERLAGLGLGQCLVDGAPRELRAAVERALGEPARPTHAPPLDGAERFADVVGDLLGAGATPAETARSVGSVPTCEPRAELTTP